MKNRTERLPLGGAVAEAPVGIGAAQAPAVAPRAPEFTFKFKRHIDGNFPGLWELVKINQDGAQEVLIDADNLSSCLETVQGFFEGIGV